MSELHKIANDMLENGILAADESVGTMNKRLQSIGAEQTERNRFEWRKILASTPDLEMYVSAVILSDDMVNHSTPDKIKGLESAVAEVVPASRFLIKTFSDKGIIPGIKVDKGAKVLAGFPREKVTEGLDGLRERLKEYADMGLKFAKWRAVLSVIPSVACVQANAHALARYAALCQEAGLVPIVEPEVLMEGEHRIGVARTATEAILHATFDALHWQGVDLKGIILKPNMVMHGYNRKRLLGTNMEVAKTTLDVLENCVPASVPGIAFLSGGQPDEDAVEHLHQMNVEGLPWRITFSYGRALQGPALRTWSGKDTNRAAAQNVLFSRAEEVYDACSRN